MVSWLCNKLTLFLQQKINIWISRGTEYSLLLTVLKHSIRIHWNSVLKQYAEMFLSIKWDPLCPDNLVLYLFVSRERLEVGCCQLAQLEHTIKQCNASAHMEAKNRGWLWQLSQGLELRCSSPFICLAHMKSCSSGAWWEGREYSRSQKNLPSSFSMVPFYIWVEGKRKSYTCITLKVRISAKPCKLVEFSVSSEGLWIDTTKFWDTPRCAGVVF